MRSKKWLVFICIMTLIFVGCGKTENEDKPSKEDAKVTENLEEDNREDVKQESSVEEESIETPSNTATQPSIGTTQSDKETNTTTKPSTETNNTSSNTNTGSTNTESNNITTKPSTGSNNSGSSNNTGSDTGNTATQPVHEHKWVEVTEEEIHYYAWRTICGKCGLDMTDMTDIDLTYHVGKVCGGRYSVEYVEVDYITENVVKTPVVTGYKCECGAEKK